MDKIDRTWDIDFIILFYCLFVRWFAHLLSNLNNFVPIFCFTLSSLCYIFINKNFRC